jgi:hypothetical protein
MSGTSMRADLWGRLSAAGLVQGDAPVASLTPTPWYVRAMLGIAGWIGAWFLVAFVGAGFVALFSTGPALITAGALLCAGAYVIFRVAPDNDFSSQFGLAVSLSGQIMVAIGMFNLLGDDFSAAFFLAVAVFEAVLAALCANFVLRVWSTAAAAVALGLAVPDGAAALASGAAAAGFTAIWLNEPSWVRRAAIWRPVGWGIALALLWFDGMLSAERAISGLRDDVSAASPLLPWLGPALVGLVLVYAVFRMLHTNGIDATSRIGGAALGATVAVALVTVGAPGVATSVLILVIGFSIGNRALFGLGVLALVGYLAHFYYALHMTLLAKSAVLAATGVVLLLARVGMRWLLGDAARSENARA